MIRSKLSILALASLMTFPLATAGCSKGQSPTEPASFEEETSAVSAVSADAADAADAVTSVTDESKGRGRGGRGGGEDDDNNNNRRRGRGRGGNGDRGNDDRRDRDDDRNRPRNGREFEGSVSSVNGDSVTIAGGTRILVNGSTQWSGRGDLFSLSEIQDSLSAGRNPRVEGRGTRQSDGSILAQTLKAEHRGD